MTLRPAAAPRPRRAALLALAAVGCAWLAAPARGATLAVAPLSDRQGDPPVAAAVDAAVRETLAGEHALVDPGNLRDVLRRRRVRVLDQALPGDLREIARATGASRVLSLTLHESGRIRTPRLALSGRAYDGASGELLWVGFEAASGLDGRTVLGLGVVDAPEVLAARAGRRLAEQFLAAERAGTPAPAAALGPVALVPLGAVTDSAGTNAAETVTEVVRSSLHRRGVALAPPSRVTAVLRRTGGRAWGGVDAPALRALADELGVRHVLTGTVETWDVKGGGEEPEPRVTVALRLVDAETGDIVWMEGRERGGWDGQGPFRLGRTYSRGDLAQQLVDSMVRRLLRERGGRPPQQRTHP